MKDNRKLEELHKALARLSEGISMVQNDLDRDGVIQRFEFTFELVWKSIQEFSRYKGLEVASPRDAIRIAADLGILANPDLWFDFLKDRNESTHIYNEDTAKLIFSHIPRFIEEVEKLIVNMSKE
jgi:nucleotidyltransferase substrate binding protein (TIGR01987 family)